MFPLLLQHFTIPEQAQLVWRFMASMPIKLMEQCLPWIASYLTVEEQLDMVRQIHRVVPNEELLQQVRRMGSPLGCVGSRQATLSTLCLIPVCDHKALISPCV